MLGVPMGVLFGSWLLLQLVGASVTELMLPQAPGGARATPRRKNFLELLSCLSHLSD